MLCLSSTSGGAKIEPPMCKVIINFAASFLCYGIFDGLGRFESYSILPSVEHWIPLVPA